ncbi:beta-lactamase inhibitory protein [Streptomyces clavuligerus]|nr:beta-lactamase inhibitory protein [Streptomyces clavuligerus]
MAPPGTMTAEKFGAAQFGMTSAQVINAIGAESCEGWPTGPAMKTATCWSSKRWWDGYAYAHLTFTNDRLTHKGQDGLIVPAAPSMTLAKYNRVTTGMTVDQVMAVVDRKSCAKKREAYPAYPSQAGREESYTCDSARSYLAYAYFLFTDGALVSKGKTDLLT